MARTKTGYKNVTVAVTEETYKALDDIHWKLRREIDDLLSEAVTKFVDDTEVSLGEA